MGPSDCLVSLVKKMIYPIYHEYWWDFDGFHWYQHVNIFVSIARTTGAGRSQRRQLPCGRGRSKNFGRRSDMELTTPWTNLWPKHGWTFYRFRWFIFKILHNAIHKKPKQFQLTTKWTAKYIKYALELRHYSISHYFRSGFDQLSVIWGRPWSVCRTRQTTDFRRWDGVFWTGKCHAPFKKTV